MCGSDNWGDAAPMWKGLALLVFIVFKIEKKEFYIMDFKLDFLREIITKLGGSEFDQQYTHG